MRVRASDYNRARRSGRATSVRVAPTGTAVEQYQVPLGQRHSLREAGVIGLPSWSEKATQTETWVKVPRLSATCPRRVVAFDGGRGDIDRTMEFGDEFDGSELDTTKWAVTAGSPSVSGSTVTVTGTANEEIASVPQFGRGYAVLTKIFMEGTNANLAFPQQVNLRKYLGDGKYALECYTDAWVLIGNSSTSTGISAVNWYRIEMRRGPTTTYSVTFDGVQKATNTHASMPTVVESVRLAIYTTSADSVVSDWLAVRKYVANEPLAGTAQPSTTNRALSRPMSHADLMRACCT